MKVTSRVLLFSVLALIIFGFTANYTMAKNEDSAVIQASPNTAVKAKMNALML
jgi:amino acid permease